MSGLDRKSFLGADRDQTLASITVGIAELLGAGSHEAQRLAHIGVGNFVLMDEYVINETNLAALSAERWRSSPRAHGRSISAFA